MRSGATIALLALLAAGAWWVMSSDWTSALPEGRLDRGARGQVRGRRHARADAEWAKWYEENKATPPGEAMNPRVRFRLGVAGDARPSVVVTVQALEPSGWTDRTTIHRGPGSVEIPVAPNIPVRLRIEAAGYTPIVTRAVILDSGAEEALDDVVLRRSGG